MGPQSFCDLVLLVPLIYSCQTLWGSEILNLTQHFPARGPFIGVVQPPSPTTLVSRLTSPLFDDPRYLIVFYWHHFIPYSYDERVGSMRGWGRCSRPLQGLQTLQTPPLRHLQFAINQLSRIDHRGWMLFIFEPFAGARHSISKGE